MSDYQMDTVKRTQQIACIRLGLSQVTAVYMCLSMYFAEKLLP